jgi:SAM-dependent methyltransferase
VPALVAVAGDLPPARALDLGCGTGAQAVYLAAEGWDVVAVDAVPRALSAARRRASAAGVTVDFRRGDVAELEALGIGDVGLAFDRGCFHGLPDAARDGYARGVTAVTRPGALLLLMAFRGPTGPGLPRGASPEEVRGRFGPPWRLVSEAPAQDTPAAARIERARPTWYRFERE